MLEYVLVLHDFSCLGNIPLRGHTTVCLSIYLLTDAQIVSTLWLLSSATVNTGIQGFV